MSRLVQITHAFARSRARLTHDEARRAKLGATIRALAAATTLPGPQDDAVMIPPVVSAHARRIAGENLWIWYTADDATLTLRALTDAPP